MIKPLSKNPDHLKLLCSQLDIGISNRPLSRVYGGFHHKMWRLETDCGIYAVKQLSADTDINNSEVIRHYNVTEAIAETFFNRGLLAIFALKSQQSYIQIFENTGYLVYPWSNAVALDQHQITDKHAFKIAGVLANMHQANIVVPGLEKPRFDIHTEEKIISLVHRADQCNMNSAKTLSQELPGFINIITAHQAALQALDKHLVISHGDLDQKNVLWDTSGNPVLIDWESARKLNPTYEIVLEALDWSGISAEFDHQLFGKILSAYKLAGGVIEIESVQAAFDGILGDWLDWLMYTIARSVDQDSEQRAIGLKQIDLVLATILRLKRLMPALLPEVLHVAGH